MQTISTEELKTLREQDSNLTLINTLPEEHFAQTQIPGSQNIPLESDDFVEQVEKAAGGKDQKVVVYCASTECDSSPKAARKLEEAGFTDVVDYEGGAKAWQESGEKLQAAV